MSNESATLVVTGNFYFVEIASVLFLPQNQNNNNNINIGVLPIMQMSPTFTNYIELQAQQTQKWVEYFASNGNFIFFF